MIKVLDHGHVGLVDHMGSDLAIVRNARVSYDAEWRAGDDEGSDRRLIRYLMRNRHNTPFEAVTFTLDVKAPIFVLRQWHRHRTQSYNELSARYRELPSEFYVPEVQQITTQSTDNKQMRTGEQNNYAKRIQSIMRFENQQSFEQYQKMLELGCPRELARTVLPVATYSHMFATMNLHNLFGFLRERLHPHAQYEVRVYAEAVMELIAPIVPVAVAAFKETLSGGRPATAVDPERFRKVADDFQRLVDEHGLHDTKVRMQIAGDRRDPDKPLCDTPACHGGWAAIMYGVGGDSVDIFYRRGADLLAQELGFEDRKALKLWAGANPQYWGNEYGEYMFCSKIAFGKGKGETLTLPDIIEWYRAVADRLEVDA